MKPSIQLLALQKEFLRIKIFHKSPSIEKKVLKANCREVWKQPRFTKSELQLIKKTTKEVKEKFAFLIKAEN